MELHAGGGVLHPPSLRPEHRQSAEVRLRIEESHAMSEARSLMAFSNEIVNLTANFFNDRGEGSANTTK